LVGGFFVFAAMKNKLPETKKTGGARGKSSATIAESRQGNNRSRCSFSRKNPGPGAKVPVSQSV
jgi:hypothetical protein